MKLAYLLIAMLCVSTCAAMNVQFDENHNLRTYDAVTGWLNVTFNDGTQLSYLIPTGMSLNFDAANTGCRQIINAKAYAGTKKAGSVLIVHPTYIINTTEMIPQTPITVRNVTLPVYKSIMGDYVTFSDVGTVATIMIRAPDREVLTSLASGIQFPATQIVTEPAPVRKPSRVSFFRR